VEEIFLNSPRAERGPWLVCTATLTKVKRVVEVAEAAIQAQTPLWIIGKPYAESDRYAQQFFALARQHSKIIRYEGAIQDRARLAQVYREARGFVLLSAWESLSLSALEAAACESPLLLSDLPWARTVFDNGAAFCPITSPSRTAPFLRRFYDAAPGMPHPSKPFTWIEIARQLEQIYHSVLDRRS
jgi:glycosyltransferase involved in cell wall biosynthesis